MAFNISDLANCKNVMAALGKATFEKLGAEEVLALAKAFEWIGGLSKRIEEELKNPPPPPIIAAPAPEPELPLGPLPPISADDQTMGMGGLSEPPKPKSRKKK